MKHFILSTPDSVIEMPMDSILTFSMFVVDYMGTDESYLEKPTLICEAYDVEVSGARNHGICSP